MSEATKADWRADPSWRLIEWSPTYFKTPPEKPTPAAELAQPSIWASEIREREVVATWYRPPTPRASN